MVQYILILIFFSVFIIYANKGWQEKNFFSFRFILLLSLGMVYILPLVTKPRPIWATDDSFMLVLLVGFLSFFIAILVFSINSPGQRNIYSRKARIRQFRVNPRMLLALSLLNIGFLLFNISRILPTFNPSEVFLFLLSDRVEAYFDDPLSRSTLFNFIKRFLTISTLLYIFHLWQRRSLFAIFFYSLIVIELLITAHTRFVILTILVLPFIYLHYYHQRLRSAVLFGILIVALVLISVGNIVRSGAFARSTTALYNEIISADMVLGQLRRSTSYSVDYFYSIYNMIHRGPLTIEYGEQYSKYLPLAPIPRVLWQQKPNIAYFYRATEMIEGLPPGEGDQNVLTTTIFGEAYHQYHYFGVFIIPFFYVMLMAFILRILQNLQFSDIIFWLLVLHVPMDIRGGMFATLITFLGHLFTIWLLFLFCYKKSHRISVANRFMDYF